MEAVQTVGRRPVTACLAFEVTSRPSPRICRCDCRPKVASYPFRPPLLARRGEPLSGTGSSAVEGRRLARGGVTGRGRPKPADWRQRRAAVREHREDAAWDWGQPTAEAVHGGRVEAREAPSHRRSPHAVQPRRRVRRQWACGSGDDRPLGGRITSGILEGTRTRVGRLSASRYDGRLDQASRIAAANASDLRSPCVSVGPTITVTSTRVARRA